MSECTVVSKNLITIPVLIFREELKGNCATLCTNHLVIQGLHPNECDVDSQPISKQYLLLPQLELVTYIGHMETT